MRCPGGKCVGGSKCLDGEQERARTEGVQSCVTANNCGSIPGKGQWGDSMDLQGCRHPLAGVLVAG